MLILKFNHLLTLYSALNYILLILITVDEMYIIVELFF